MHAYRRLFARPGVTSVAVAAVLTRLPTSMLGLSLLLSVLRVRGSYVDGGLVLTVHAISVAASAPVGGRLADRVNPRAALGGFLGVFLLAVVGVLACLLAAVPLGGLLAAVALLGAATPPAGAVIRANWPRLVDGDQLRTAFAFDGVLNELTYIAGPLAFSLLVLVVEPYVVLCLAGLSMLAGVLVLLRAGTARVPRARGNLMGPLGTPRVLVVLVLGLLDAFLYGCLFVGSAAAAERIGSPGLAGLLIAAMSVGAAVGGLGYGARSWRGSPAGTSACWASRPRCGSRSAVWQRVWSSWRC
jgi:MFS family permease